MSEESAVGRPPLQLEDLCQKSLLSEGHSKLQLEDHSKLQLEGCVWADLNISLMNSRTQIVFLLLGNKPSLSLLALPKLLELDSLKESIYLRKMET